MSEFFTSSEVARRLRASPRAVWRWVQLGRLRPRRDHRGRLVFDAADVERAVDRYEFGDPDEGRNDAAVY